MKAIPQVLDDKLLAYLDNTLSPSETLELQQQVEHDMALKARLEALRKIHEALQQITIEEPSRNFTQAVMGKLDQAAAPSSGISIRNGILLLVAVLAATGMALYLLSGGVFDNATTPVDLPTMNLPEKYFDQPLPPIYFDGKLMINIIILLNLGLAWVVLDRTILRPYFKRRQIRYE
jgi:anti-sigma factor RsiW